MDQLKKEDKLLKGLMKHSLVELPFQDFEERMMDKIRQEKQQHNLVQHNIRFAWIFFVLGLFLGLLITNMTANLNQQLYGISLKKIAVFIQIGIAFVLLFQFERLLNLTFRKKN